MERQDQMQELVYRMSRARRVTIMTGAGVSAASGVPTFREAGGLWEGERPEDVATPGAFQMDPARVWRWYGERRQGMARCTPNRAHEVIASWSERYSDFRLVTQNIDGLHEAAGTRNVIRFHGSIWEVSCWEKCPGSRGSWEDRQANLGEIPPLCPHCKGYLRPAVVWFGEGIDPEVLEGSLAAVDCDVFFSIGTSAVVQPAASLLLEAKRGGAYTVEVNLESTPSSGLVDCCLPGRAEETLDELERLLA